MESVDSSAWEREVVYIKQEKPEEYFLLLPAENAEENNDFRFDSVNVKEQGAMGFK